MERTEYITRIREYLHDPEGKVFADAEISNLLNAAMESYCYDTMAFCADFDCLVEEDGTCSVPENYLGFIAGWNSENLPLTPISTTDLSRFIGDYSAREGLGEFVTDDNSSVGTIRIVPNPYELQGYTVYRGASDYGIMVAQDYGTIDHAEDYGIATRAVAFTVTAAIHYFKLEELESADDYMAVIFRAVADAFAADGDFQDLDKAELYDNLYQKRIALRKVINQAPRVIRRGGKFF